MRQVPTAGGKAPRSRFTDSPQSNASFCPFGMRGRCLIKRTAGEEPSLGFEYGPSQRKARLTDDAMAARLAGIHLHGFPTLSPPPARQPTPDSEDSLDIPSDDSSPPALEEDSSMDEGINVPSSSALEDELPRLEVLHPELRAYIEAKNNAFSPWIRQPSSCNAVVLWEPPEAKLERILGSRNGDCDSGDGGPFVTFPSEDRPKAAPSARFTRRPPSPLIQELHDEEDLMEL